MQDYSSVTGSYDDQLLKLMKMRQQLESKDQPDYPQIEKLETRICIILEAKLIHHGALKNWRAG